MITKLQLLAVILLSAFCQFPASSQTTTIDYTTASFSTTACNVFNPSVNFAGLAHHSFAGGVRFVASKGIELDATPTSGGATAFYIDYSFAGGYKYDISIVAENGNASLYLNTSAIPNFNQFTTSTQTGCTTNGNDANVNGYSTVGYGQLHAATATASTTYTVPQFTVPANINTYGYLMIWVSGGRSNVSLEALSISKIIITRTSTTASFTLSPMTTTLSCGSTTPVTFTVNNNSGATGISGYTWNLGSASNGWIYNGSPAPQTISTSTNTLTLTPNCGSTQSNITCAVTVNGTNVNTNTGSITYNVPALSISGSNALCSGNSQYQVSGLPCNASVTWTSSNTSIATVSQSGNVATLTQVGTGTITLTANVSGLCGAPTQAIPLPIKIGNGPSDATFIVGTYTHYLESYNNVCVGSGSQAIQIVFAPDAQNVTAYAYSGNYPTVYQSGGQWVVSYSLGSAGANGGTGTLYIQYTNACGSVTQIVYFHNTCTYYGSRSFKVGPNPASNNVTITSVNDPSSATGDDKSQTSTVSTDLPDILEVKILDKLGNVRKDLKNAKGIKKQTVSLSGLSTDIYTLQVFDGQNWNSYQLSVISN